MEQEKKYCPDCGTELNKEAKFCTECGRKFSEEKKKGRPKKEVIQKEEPKEEPQIIYKEVIKEPSGFEKSKKYIYPILSCFITFVLCLFAFTCFYKYYMKNLVIETTRTEKEVTITENGISESVNKVYDAVVVVESYVRGQLYATGSGFVYKTDDNNGYILTNNHVISSANEVKVVFSNNKRVTVKVVGSDSYSDVALLSVPKENVISVAEIGSTEELKVGDTAFAIGAPLDSSTYAWTVTRGIISGKNRTVQVSLSSSAFGRSNTIAMEVLQTDAAINNGNSGGALCNSNGEVIGITNMKLASSTIEGMGFAIPIETAVKNAEEFLKGGKVNYPYLGVAVYDAINTTDEEEITGVIIDEVESKSPAEKGGLEKGDRIIKINDYEVQNTTLFKHYLYKYSTGDKVKITIIRNNKEKVLDITLGSANMSA